MFTAASTHRTSEHQAFFSHSSSDIMHKHTYISESMHFANPAVRTESVIAMYNIFIYTNLHSLMR